MCNLQSLWFVGSFKVNYFPKAHFKTENTCFCKSLWCHLHALCIIAPTPHPHPGARRSLWSKKRGKETSPSESFLVVCSMTREAANCWGRRLESFSKWVSKTTRLCISEDALVRPDGSFGFAQLYTPNIGKKWSQCCCAGHLCSHSNQWHLLARPQYKWRHLELWGTVSSMRIWPVV